MLYVLVFFQTENKKSLPLQRPYQNEFFVSLIEPTISAINDSVMRSPASFNQLPETSYLSLVFPNFYVQEASLRSAVNLSSERMLSLSLGTVWFDKEIAGYFLAMKRLIKYCVML